MKRCWFIWMALFVAAVSAQSQEVSAVLDHDQIKIGEQTTIQLEVRFPAATKSIMMPALQDTISKFVEIIDVTDIDTTFDEEDITTKIFTQTITITSWDSGFHVIPPFLFIVGTDTINTKPLLLTVNTIKVQPDQDIKDIKNIIEIPFSLWDWILSHRIILGSILLAIILLIIGIILYKRYLNRPKVDEPIFIPKEAADIIAEKKLGELRAKKLWQKDKIKDYYSELSFIVREYIENRFHLRALEQTTDEIIALINNSSEVTNEQKDKLYGLLFLADMAKYAKQKPIASENEDVLKVAYQFIKETALKAKLEEENPTINHQSKEEKEDA